MHVSIYRVSKEGPLLAGLTVRVWLYAATAVIGAGFGIVTDDWRPWVLVVISVIGIAVGWRPSVEPTRQIWRIFVYEALVAVALAALGLPGLGLLVLATSTGVSSLRPRIGRRVGVYAGIAGAGIGGVAELVDASVLPVMTTRFPNPVGPLLAAFVIGSLTSGVAALFRRVGTEVERQRQILKDMPRRQRRLMDITPEPVFVHRDGEILYANPAAVALAGNPLPSIHEVFDIGLNREELAEILSDTSTQPRQATVTTGDETRIVELVQHLIDWEGDVAFHLTARDLSELERTRAELKDLFDRLPVALYRSLPTGEVIAANPALSELLGYDSVEDILNDPSASLTAHPDRDLREEWRRRIEADGSLIGFEQNMVTVRGERLRVSDSAVVVRSRGEVDFYEGAIVDVTSRWEAEATQRRMVTIIDSTSDFVAVANERGGITSMNPALRGFVGIEEDDVGGMTASDLIYPGQDDLVKQITVAVLRDGRWSGDIDIIGSGRRRATVTATVHQHDSEDGERYLSFVGRDVTEERATARRLRELVKAKDEFVASVSHELRTPLAAVLGIASELKEAYETFDDHDRRDLIGLLAEQSQEVSNIVEDLLVAARADTGSIVLTNEAVDLAEMTEAVIRGLPEVARSRVRSSAAGSVAADGRRVRQIVRNLLTNALRYGGESVQIRAQSMGEWVELTVEDDGEGIPQELWERIFEPFERAHEVGTQPNSVGLGLSVSRWLARKMCGDLTYEYEGSSRFTLRLPGGDRVVASSDA